MSDSTTDTVESKSKPNHLPNAYQNHVIRKHRNTQNLVIHFYLVDIEGTKT
jgi:hypothetical protein